MGELQSTFPVHPTLMGSGAGVICLPASNAAEMWRFPSQVEDPGDHSFSEVEKVSVDFCGPPK